MRRRELRISAAAQRGLYVVLALVLASSTPLWAQTIRGVVSASPDGRPLENASIALLDQRGRDLGKRAVRSDSSGRFTIHAGETGTYMIRAIRIGYAPATSGAISLPLGAQVANVTLHMSPDTTKLSTVVVTGTTRLNTYELMSYVGFDLRMSKGHGKYLDTAALSEFRKHPIGWVLEDAKTQYGVDILQDGFGRDYLVMSSGLYMCNPETWLDGFPSALPILLGLGADQLYGVEIYNSNNMPSASIGALLGTEHPMPTLFSVHPNAARMGLRARVQMKPCGAIVAWTRQHVEVMRAREKKPPDS